MSCIHHFSLTPIIFGTFESGTGFFFYELQRESGRAKARDAVKSKGSPPSAAALLAACRTTHARVALGTSATAWKRVPKANSMANAAEERGRPTGANFDRSNAALDASRPVFIVILILNSLIYKGYSCLFLMNLAGTSVFEH